MLERQSLSTGKCNYAKFVEFSPRRNIVFLILDPRFSAASNMIKERVSKYEHFPIQHLILATE